MEYLLLESYCEAALKNLTTTIYLRAVQEGEEAFTIYWGESSFQRIKPCQNETHWVKT